MFALICMCPALSQCLTRQIFCFQVDRVENDSLGVLFDLKKTQLSCFTSRKMFQCIQAQFFDMVSQIGFHSECAPPHGMIVVLQVTLKTRDNSEDIQEDDFTHVVFYLCMQTQHMERASTLPAQ